MPPIPTAPDGAVPVEMDLGQDYEALIWMQDNIQGSPVVLEAWANLYRWGSRVSVYTGLPTVIGWDWHQNQQRPGYGELITKRRADVDAMFDPARDFASIRPLLDKYHVQYIYIGPLERIYYGDAGVAKFEQARGRWAARDCVRPEWRDDLSLCPSVLTVRGTARADA